MKSPLQQVTERFTNKEGLVAAVKALTTDDLWISRTNNEKGLDSVSNKKLLHLHDTLAKVKKDHGTRAALVAAVMKKHNRAKDDGYKARLEKWPLPRLVDALENSKA